MKIIACTPNNPDWQWYADKIGQEFPLLTDGIEVIEIWDGNIGRLVLKADVERID